jgi:hypothetical protein
MLIEDSTKKGELLIFISLALNMLPMSRLVKAWADGDRVPNGGGVLERGGDSLLVLLYGRLPSSASFSSFLWLRWDISAGVVGLPSGATKLRFFVWSWRFLGIGRQFKDSTAQCCCSSVRAAHVFVEN